MTDRLLFCNESELTESRMVVRRLLARRFAAVRKDGQIIAFDADCRHMRAPLETGELNGGILRCPWHGWEYDLLTGVCLTRPGMDLRHYQTEVVDGKVYLIFTT